jgi:cyanophycin synthetase
MPPGDEKIQPNNIDRGFKSAPRYGYVPGFGQPLKPFKFEIPQPGKINFTALDRLLKECLSLDEIPALRIQEPVPKQTREFVWRVLVVAAQLSQAVNIPKLEPGVILSVSAAQDKVGTLMVKAMVPFVQHLPLKTEDLAYHYAVRLVHLAQARHQPREEVDALLNQVYTQFVLAHRKFVGGGESTIPLLETAYGREIPFSHCGNSIYRLGWGSKSRLIDRSAIETDSAIGGRLAQNKVAAAVLMRDAGLPAPVHLLVSSESEAQKAAARLGWPLVVKPPNLDRGEGVTVDIVDSDNLINAFRKAKALSPSVLIERQVKGVCHRIYVINRNQVLFVSQRLSKSVKGDGEHSVSELIKEANRKEQLKAPWLRLKPFPMDNEALNCLADEGLDFESIPDAGQYAPLRRIQSDAEGGVAENLTDRIHPENRDIAIRAAALFNLDSAGIDLITEDVSVPWYENGAILNEVNYASLVSGGRRTGSQRSDYLNTLLATNIEGDGKIPVEIYVGENALEAALSRQQDLVVQGLRCFVTSHELTYRPDGTAMVLQASGLFALSQCLLANKQVEALVLVVQTDELAVTGSPVSSITSMTVIDQQLKDFRGLSARLPSQRIQLLLRLLKSFATNP